MNDIVDRYHSAIVEPAPKDMLDEAIAEIKKLRARIAKTATDSSLCAILRRIAGVVAAFLCKAIIMAEPPRTDGPSAW